MELGPALAWRASPGWRAAAKPARAASLPCDAPSAIRGADRTALFAYLSPCEVCPAGPANPFFPSPPRAPDDGGRRAAVGGRRPRGRWASVGEAGLSRHPFPPGEGEGVRGERVAGDSDGKGVKHAPCRGRGRAALFPQVPPGAGIRRIGLERPVTDEDLAGAGFFGGVSENPTVHPNERGAHSSSPKSPFRSRQALWMWLAGFLAESACTFRNSITNPGPCTR